jgi:hypothetical protein
VLARAAGPEGPERLPALRPSTSGRRALKLLLAALLALALVASGGCGGDEEPSAETEPALPNLTVPQGDTTETAPETQAEEVPEEFDPSTETLPPETVPPSTGGGTPAPEAEPPPDTPENDTPPPADSPAERFEEFCDDNPGACG